MQKLFFLSIIFLNAFIDIGHKITLQNIAFKAYNSTEQIILVSIINALILLPFIFLFSPAGFISDKYSKEKVMKYCAFIGIILSSGLMISYYFGMFYFSFFMLFLLAVQSTFYSPAKLGYIKSLYGETNLATGNSYAQAVGTISILISMLFFSIFFEHLYEISLSNSSDILKEMFPISIFLFVLSIFEFIFTLFLPSFDKKYTFISFSLIKYLNLSLLKENIQKIKKGDGVLLSIIGLSIFFGVVQGIFTIFPAYAKEYLSITNTIIINGMIATSGIGIIFGTLLYSKYSKHFIELGTIPFSAFFMSLLFFMMIHSHNVYFLYILFFSFGIMGGLFIIPLNSLIQFNSSSDNLGSVLAGNNWFQSIAMFFILTLTTSFAYFDFNSLSLLYFLFFTILFGSLYTLITLPQSLIQFLLSRLVKHRYKVVVNGIDNIPSNGPILFLGNHISFLDWAILQISSPRRIKFVMDKAIYNKWYFHYFLKFFGVIPISGNGSKDSLKLIAEALNNDEAVCIFPEGKISRNGHLGEFKKGFELVLELVEQNKSVAVIPFFLQGLWGTIFSRANEYYTKNIDRYFEVSCSFGKKLDKEISVSSLKKAIFDLSVISWKKYLENSNNLQQEIIKRSKFVGSKMLMADSTGMKLSGYRTLGLAITFRNVLKPLIQGKNIGLIVPSTVIGNISNLALLMLGKTLVNLNYTSSIESLISSVKLADIKTIIVSRKFIDKIQKKGFDLNPVLSKIENVIYLEDLKPNLSKITIFKNILISFLFSSKFLNYLYCSNNKKSETAVILFSSGSEGTPKGIELSHNNLLSNIKQISTVLEANEDDLILGNLPIFHAFGLTVTTLLPMVEGIPVVSHPDPTDGFGIGKLVATYNATIMCGTSTFLRLYSNNKKVNPLMFDSLRIVISGAEKLDAKVRDNFKQKFGKIIYEGYGATETSPVASVNIPDRLEPNWKIQQGNKFGTVGLPLPGTSIKIVDPIEIDKFIQSSIIDVDFGITHSIKELDNGQEGMIIIGGPQIMKSYFNNPEKTNEVLFNMNGITWYITGDKGKIDENGFLTIVDRYSRFAKIGGEMISLTAVENKVAQVLDNENVDSIAINIPDAKKGEKIVLIIENKSILNEEDIIDNIKRNFENKLMLPSTFIFKSELPKLGSGKKDFKLAKQLYFEEY